MSNCQRCVLLLLLKVVFVLNLTRHVFVLHVQEELAQQQNISLSAQVSPCESLNDHSPVRQVLFHRSISEIAGTTSTATQENGQLVEDANRLGSRRRINSGGMAGEFLAVFGETSCQV